MRVSILTIGDEITSGHIVDTNAAYLASRLAAMGIQAERIVSVRDDVDAIASELARMQSESDVVLVTGGLGPTLDDVTKEGIAKALNRPLKVDQDVLANLERRYATRADAKRALLENIANLPEGSSCYTNPLGAAPGFAVKTLSSVIYVLPGVPDEMKAIFEDSIAAEIAALCKDACSITKVITTFGLTESTIARMIGEGLCDFGGRLGYLPKTSGVELRLTADAPTRDQALEILEGAVSKVCTLLKDNVVSTDGKRINVVVGEMLIEKKATIAVAESCTGGLIGHLLTEVAGISTCLERDIVAYSNKTKIELLGVDGSLIENHGAVSEEVAAAMAKGVKETAGTLVGLSTTGIAGPTGGTPEKPVGTVFIGMAYDKILEVKKASLKGNRSGIKQRAAFTALDMVRRMLLSKG